MQYIASYIAVLIPYPEMNIQTRKNPVYLNIYTVPDTILLI